jgi:hypothetical protein
MSYHEAFWITCGTAAPVLALANIVAAGSTASAMVSRARSIADKVKAGDGAFLIQVLRKGLPEPRRIYSKPYWLAVAGFCLDLVVLALSLLALGRRADGPTLWTAGTILVGSFVLLALQAILLAASNSQAD